MKLKIVENWRSLWRAFSVQSMALSSAIIATWQVMPLEMKQGIAPENVMWASVVVLLLGIVGRYLKQDKVSGE